MKKEALSKYFSPSRNHPGFLEATFTNPKVDEAYSDIPLPEDADFLRHSIRVPRLSGRRVQHNFIEITAPTIGRDAEAHWITADDYPEVLELTGIPPSPQPIKWKAHPKFPRAYLLDQLANTEISVTKSDVTPPQIRRVDLFTPRDANVGLLLLDQKQFRETPLYLNDSFLAGVIVGQEALISKELATVEQLTERNTDLNEKIIDLIEEAKKIKRSRETTGELPVILAGDEYIPRLESAGFPPGTFSSESGISQDANAFSAGIGYMLSAAAELGIITEEQRMFTFMDMSSMTDEAMTRGEEGTLSKYYRATRMQQPRRQQGRRR